MNTRFKVAQWILQTLDTLPSQNVTKSMTLYSVGLAIVGYEDDKISYCKK